MSMLPINKFLVLILSVAVQTQATIALAAESPVKQGLTDEDALYTLAEGITTREVTWYSDDVMSYAKLFFPQNFDSKAKTPAVVLGQGWTGTHHSIEKYAARFAEKGLVAMVIDYRGWGLSNGIATLVNRDTTMSSDTQHIRRSTEEVIIKRTRLIPSMQVQDYRNAISYIQGEPGVDQDRIGLWGSSYAGGHVITVAGLDARAKVLVGQVPAVSGYNTEPAPFAMPQRMLDDAIARARNGQGGTMTTGFSNPREVDLETSEKSFEYRPFHYLKHIGDRPVLLIAAEKEQLFKNDHNAKAAIDALTGPKKYIVVPNITHFEMYIDEAFEVSANEAADWFVTHLGKTLPTEN